MRILLCNQRTGRYYSGPRQPGSGVAHAHDFGSVPAAAKFTFEEKLPDVEIVVRYDSHGTEIHLPVLAVWCLFGEESLRPVPETPFRGPPHDSLDRRVA